VDVAEEVPAPAIRSHRVRWTLVALAVLAVSLGWYRATGPKLAPVGFGTGLAIERNEAAHIGIPLSTTGGTLHLGRLTLRGDTGRADVSWAISDRGVGAARGELDPETYGLSTADGATVTHDEPGESTWLVVSITPRSEEMLVFDGIDVEHGSGLRRRTQHLDVDICIPVIRRGEEMQDALRRCGRLDG
jgi:hypothetical protein